MTFAEFPSRRDEAWKYSDLRVAMNRLGVPEPLLSGNGHIVERMMAGMERKARRTIVPTGETQSVVALLDANAGLESSAEIIDVGPGAAFNRLVLQGGQGVCLDLVKVRLGRGAVFRQFTLAEGADLARLETEIAVAEPGAKIELNGVYLAAAKRHADLTSRVVLNAEGAEVRQIVKGAARRGGRGVFQGKFKLERAAQKTDARMSHNALLLEEGAEIFAKPELEIYADDVQCAHGNTSGQVDEAAVFYLRSRGIAEAEARAMITRAFLLDAIPDWLDAELREEAESRIDTWLGAAS